MKRDIIALKTARPHLEVPTPAYSRNSKIDRALRTLVADGNKYYCDSPRLIEIVMILRTTCAKIEIPRRRQVCEKKRRSVDAKIFSRCSWNRRRRYEKSAKYTIRISFTLSFTPHVEFAGKTRRRRRRWRRLRVSLHFIRRDDGLRGLSASRYADNGNCRGRRAITWRFVAPRNC